MKITKKFLKIEYLKKKKSINQIRFLQEKGYRTLIILENELENLNKVSKKVLTFNKE